MDRDESANAGIPNGEATKRTGKGEMGLDVVVLIFAGRTTTKRGHQSGTGRSEPSHPGNTSLAVV